MNPSLSSQSVLQCPDLSSPAARSAAPLATPAQIKASASTFDEPLTRSLLGGDSQQISHALALIEQHLHHTLTRWLMQRLPSLALQDLDDIWSDTLLAVLRAARAGRFQSDRPLLPWLCHIARRRAIDHLRLRSACSYDRRHLPRRPDTYDRPTEDSSVHEILQLLRDFLPTLPPRQKTVLAVFIDQLPERPPLTDLQQEVSRRSGQQTTLLAVKRSLQVVRQKLSHHLQERGYVLPAGIGE